MLPAKGQYAGGLVFLPTDKAQRGVCQDRFEALVAEEGQKLLGWRKVPVCGDVLGHLSRHAQPAIYQIFIGQGGDVRNQTDFERKLYVIRKQIEHTIRDLNLYFHIPSLSSKTFVYKGMFQAHQLEAYFPDLADKKMESALAVVHQRYSTNTFPTWDLAQPFRFLCHNGEINTLRGNSNWLRAREALMSSDRLGSDLVKVLPVVTPGASDSATLDAMLELLYHAGRPLPHCVMMLIPEAWQHHTTMGSAKKEFYAYHANLMEPWDGPAAVCFTDGRWLGAVLDRNGLRPSRYTVTHDGLVVLASEAGVLDIAPEQVKLKERLAPGRMFLVDLEQGRWVDDEEIKTAVSESRPYGQWLKSRQIVFQPPDKEPAPCAPALPSDAESLKRRQHIFGYTQEDLKILLSPMAQQGKEPLGSMGDDTPPAILSRRPRLLYDYFKQLFAQVTNPPLDGIRESLVTALNLYIGPEQNILDETPNHCRRIKLSSPILTASQLNELRANTIDGIKSCEIGMCFTARAGAMGLARGMSDLCLAASKAVADGAGLLILTDRGVDEHTAPIPALLAVAGVHHHLIRQGTRTQCDLVVESAEPREVHHFCCLLGYGAGGIHPYLAFSSLKGLVDSGRITQLDESQAARNYIHAIEAGILKVISKMGISTLQSYRGAQIFECLGLSDDVVRQYFTETVSRIGGAGLDKIATEITRRHEQGFLKWESSKFQGLDSGGRYQWRRGGESHQYNPNTLTVFRQAVFDNDESAFGNFASQINRQNGDEGLLRGLISIKSHNRPIPIEAVEPWTDIVKRFKTGAMSYGSISQEAHEALAVAMNRIGARSNSGEGGEDPDRYRPDENGDWRNSAIKQVASGRFGVTGPYLVNARELQIKMAQGAKPGEGGQLPGFKVYPWIAKTRHSTPYVGLISPPPHHDIYSIEDLSQLIFDLKCANPRAKVSVKLVSAAGVGTIAAGVAKGGAHTILISGESGGTGASPVGSIRHCGLPWELGLPETHQTLLMNGLRERVVLECDGQLKTGHDVAVACMLGAQEFGFGTLALVALGCVMMRVCHLNTCPVGIATQDPELRKKFTGSPDHVVNLMRLIAEDLRRIMAQLGMHTVEEMVGRVDLLDFQPAIDHWKSQGVDLSQVLAPPKVPPHILKHCQDLPAQEKEYDRELPQRRPVDERINDYEEIYQPFPQDKAKNQAARCMDCGVATCISGCPLGNLIPEWNDALYRGLWKEAIERLHATNNFPEFTGRLCPAPCEEACVLSINEPAVTIEQIEKEIIEHAFAQGWIRPNPPCKRSGKKVAVVGSGPSGLACAQQLNRAGHLAVVFERDDRIGGLLRYGIPDFKMNKRIIDRRLEILKAEGIEFKTQVHVGVDITADDLNAFDAVVLCPGATIARDLPLPGRKLDGIHFAMDFLTQQNRHNAGDRPFNGEQRISAAGKHVVIIGGGDTGSDCVGTCNRQKAKSITNFEAAAMPTPQRPDHQPWPYYPMRLRTTSSHEEGVDRHWSIMTTAYLGSRGKVEKLTTVDIKMIPQPDAPPEIEEIPDTQREWPADLVLLAIGYLGPETDTIADQLGLDVTAGNTIATDENYQTQVPGIFSAGDAHRGQSLIVWAISEGRGAARAVDVYLTGSSDLPGKGCCDLTLK